MHRYAEILNFSKVNVKYFNRPVEPLLTGCHVVENIGSSGNILMGLSPENLLVNTSPGFAEHTYVYMQCSTLIGLVSIFFL